MTEFELIAKLTEAAPRSARDLSQGVGDDCAVIAGPSGRDWLVTADALIEGVHFSREWTDLRTLGRKAISANLSDIAAMGGVPRFYVVSIAIPETCGEQGARDLYAGMRECADACGAWLIGGDTSASPSGLMISIALIGEVENGKAILRSGAKPGDPVYVTGAFGGAALGLAALKAGKQDLAAQFVGRHLDPKPRTDAGAALMECGMVSAMVDSSDGLLADLSHIADASGAGFEIEEALVPREPGFSDVAAALGLDPSRTALAGGEEYELIFTVSSAYAEEIDRRVLPSLPVCAVRIGRMTADSRERSVWSPGGTLLEFGVQGYDHFARRGL